MTRIRLEERITADKNPDCPPRCQHIIVPYPTRAQRISGNVPEIRQCKKAADRWSIYCGQHKQ